ncbi:hypothetical protein J7T55_007245 [Diaporthe amygdali]|uniref:uncharacterized protein n=1 Tax=Phomopsis amygdali TaxID=1214568 RepID=UPI0022FE5E1A|nr:uncharacterized protein J7T55_007245 [Diaporthe amygdali]KAJ0108126.1 hypothetical protein J7T55_007245 [Diaporthe amygdali]
MERSPANNKLSIQVLREQMENNMVRSDSKRWFLPETSLRTTFTPAAVQKAVEQLCCRPDQRINLVEAILCAGVKTFAILVWMEKEDHIVSFRAHQALDDRLPFSEELAKTAAPDFGARLAREEQWRLLPFRFPPKMHEHHLEIEENRILPLVGRPHDLAEGSFGQIVTISVWPTQQDFVPDHVSSPRFGLRKLDDSVSRFTDCRPALPQQTSPVQLILKRLKTRISKKAYQQEQMCLRLLNQLRHPNIIPFLGSYSYGIEQNFLFPRLEMDLKKFLSLEERPVMFQHDFTFYSALRGLCSALLSVHNLHLNQDQHGVDFDGIGYHHDIRPANILVDQYNFILADFGLGNFKDPGIKSQTTWFQTVGDYLAPECMDNLHSQEVGRSIDVWAMGCLFADIATYIELGSTGVSEFSDKRLEPSVSGWETSLYHKVDGSVKTQVVQWLRTLSNRGASGSVISPLVDLCLQALTRDPLQRPTISNISQKLTFMSLQAYFGATKDAICNFCRDQSSPARELIRTRFVAWGNVLKLDGSWQQELESLSTSLDRMYDEGVESMRSMFSKLYQADESTDNTILESEIDDCVSALWRLLPPDLAKRARDYWEHLVLATDDTKHLEDLEQVLSSARFSAFYTTKALAMMRTIRLRLTTLDPQGIDSNDPLRCLDDGAPNARLFNASDVTEIDSTTGSWGIGRLEFDKSPVLVEWMWYVMKWHQAQVTPEQRTLLMSLRAQSFGMVERPKGLRTLDCVGIFEKSDANFGYGFVYRVPPGMHSQPTPLHTLLDQDSGRQSQPKPQPLLGDKFKLAASLARFLKEFHTIGWLHENFNSHNILFFTHEPRELPLPSELQEPYFIGLHKSRPDGSLWQTDGPDLDAASDYQHPEYASSGRYNIDFDYYSLGIVLLEIGLWRSLSGMISGAKYQKMNAGQLREEHVRRCRTRLGSKMGKVYTDVVTQCLSGSLKVPGGGQTRQGRNLAADTAILGRFIESVVEPLECLALAPI